MTKEKQAIGRAKTVLVYGQGDREKAMVSAIVVRTKPLTDGEARLHFTGNVDFSNPVKDHIQETILPVVDRVIDGMELLPKKFLISAVNLGVASSLDLGMHISGFSADISIFLGMLSAGLQIPLTDDIVTTGHIASVAGDISAVKAIPAKIEAVKAEGSVTRFI